MVKNTDNERREYFRIDDRVYLEYQIINEQEYNEAPTTLENLHDSAFSLSADFATLNNSIHPLLNNIKQLHPDIGEYLEFLNQKIDSLGHHVYREDNEYEQDKFITANLSASGISFETCEKHTLNQPIKLEVVLLPEKVGILIFGRINNIKEDKGKYCISVEFEHVREQDKELLIKHNLNKQMADIREKNNN